MRPSNYIRTAEDMQFGATPSGPIILCMALCALLYAPAGATSTPSPLDGYEMAWKVEGGSLTLTLTVQTEGWLGFGISGGAGMKGADFVRVNGDGLLEDGFALLNVEPRTADCQQDWSLVSRVMKEGVMMAAIR